MLPESQSVVNAAVAALLHASWQAGVLALVVLAVSAVAGRRLDPRVRFGLWLLVFVRLAMPVVPAAPWSMFGWFSTGPVELVIPADGISVPAANGHVAGPKPTARCATVPGASKPMAAQRASPSADLTTHLAISAWAVAASIWLVGVLVLIVRLVLGAMRLDRANSPLATAGRRLTLGDIRGLPAAAWHPPGRFAADFRRRNRAGHAGLFSSSDRDSPRAGRPAFARRIAAGSGARVAARPPPRRADRSAGLVGDGGSLAESAGLDRAGRFAPQSRIGLRRGAVGSPRRRASPALWAFDSEHPGNVAWASVSAGGGRHV